VETVLGASFIWLQNVPTGKVLHLFSGTLNMVQDRVCSSTELFLFQGQFVFVISGVIIVGYPPFAIFVAFLALVAVYIVMRTGRKQGQSEQEQELQQDVVHHFTEVLGGIVVIRAFDTPMVWFEQRFDEMVQSRAAVKGGCIRSDELSIQNLTLIGSMFYVGAAAAVVAGRGEVTAGYAGFMIVNACYFTIAFMASVFQGMLVLDAARAREVLFALCRDVPQEETKQEAAQAWPELTPTGHLVVEKVELRYSPDLPPALRGISLEIQPGQHIGLVGRTGSGKSSILLALARLVSPCGGRILLDGVDTSAMPLAALRHQLAILSQDPLFFSGTIRENLDPFQQHEDAALEAALKWVGLSELPEGLRASVAELGGNLSTGQRQLLCVARVALRESRVLLVDEATAALDRDAEARVRAVLDDRFRSRGVTVVEVAHRLWSVVRCDVVAVMDAGCVAEMGSPSELIAGKSGAGHLASLVNALDPAEAQAVRDAAFAAA